MSIQKSAGLSRLSENVLLFGVLKNFLLKAEKEGKTKYTLNSILDIFPPFVHGPTFGTLIQNEIKPTI